MQNLLANESKSEDLPVVAPVAELPPAPEAPAPAPMPEAEVKPEGAVPAVFGSNPPLPSPKQQSWGVVISIVIIVLMITIGAFYAWGARLAQEAQLAPVSGQ